jgi:WD domain, G-beta repeat
MMTGQVSGPGIPARIVLPPDGTPGIEGAPPGRIGVVVDAMDRYFGLAFDSGAACALPQIADRCEFLEDALLSPDGMQLAISGTEDLLVLDLSTGMWRTYSVLPEGDVSTLAWSADGRQLACGVDGELAVVELPYGLVRALDLDGEEAGAVAFSPDGTRLAVDLDEGVGLVVLGPVPQLVAMPVEPDEELSGHAAWSPDGRFLAVEEVRDVEGEPDEEEYVVTLLAVAGAEPARSGHQLRIDGVTHLDLAGWRSADELVFVEHRRDGIAVVVRDLDGAEVDVLAVAAPELFDVQLASGLLAR